MQIYIANPVRVTATRILEVTVEYPPEGTFVTVLRLEDGTNFRAEPGMTARHTPVPGDYLVTQEDGYTYLNPRDVFERKYRALPAMPAGLAPHQQRVVEEKAELDPKITALTAFINANPIFGTLPEPERMRLYAQHLAMLTYSNMLAERIAAF